MNLQTHAQPEPLADPRAADGPLRRHLRQPRVNITPAERAGRIGLGVAAVIAAAVLLVSAASVLAVVLEVLLAAAGLDLAVTGTLGHCPLYQRLGHIPKSLRRPS
ncbi:MAG TPA: YgaP-like transmembrane domain [Streptosporangiaceae bacterium]|nr:YgaP-like transmembrane domain [Streptosporangiaceae bacterium]